MRDSDSHASAFAMLDAVSSAMFAHRGGNILYANAALERLTGLGHDELRSMPFYAIARPEDQEQVRDICLARLAGERVAPAQEFRVVSRSGELRYVELKASVVDVDGAPTVVGSFYDLTDRRRAQAAQGDMQLLMAQIIDGDPVPTLVIDAQHRVTHWNKACAAVIGTPAIEMLGTTRQWAAFYPAERPLMADLIVNGATDSDLEKHYKGKFCRSALIEGAYEAEDFFPHFGDKGRWLYFTAAPLRNAEGAIVGAIETLQDVSARHAAEDELRRYQVQLEQLVGQRTEQLESANRQLVQSEKLASIGQLAAGVAHEINNPMGYVFSNISTLEKYQTDLFRMLDVYEEAEPAIAAADVAASVKAMREEVDLAFLKEDIPLLMSECKEGVSRVKGIVQDLKDFSRVDSALEWQWADLHKGIDSTINMVANEVKYTADIVKEYGVLPDVECLPSQLNQVFMNLLINAAHAMGPARGTITIRTGVDGESVWLAFADTGRGMSQETQKKIFDPFFTTKPIGKGTGLGLSLAYGIIQNHGGSIDVQSALDQGTVFRITLPITHVSPSAA